MAVVPGMFDVFLNHRGPDVKQNFAAHLHQALQEAGCRPFLDMKSLEQGQHDQKKIDEALGYASVHVAIFSKDYAYSNYCLDELCAMLKSEKLIIPVFYDVSPNDLHCKLDNGPYTKAFHEIHGRRQASEVKKWKDALRMAAQLAGFKLADYNGDEAQLKTAIVSKVRDHLRASQLTLVPPYKVGLQETSKELIETLNWMEKDVGVLGLVGMGGIGKTTLAKEIYWRFEKNDTFERKSFLMDVRESAILDLQKQLARDLFREDVRSMEEFNKCFNHVMDCKVLIVIDDIDQKGQFDQLIPDINKLRAGSRVIITSRDSNVVNNIVKNGNCKYSMHEMALLNTIDSRHLFNCHAFHSVDAIDGFHELAKNVADACCGLPLALEATGCFLFDKRGECDIKSTWPQTIKTLLNENKYIFKKLMISYNGLSPEARMMFLDIACFIIGQREHIAMQIFEACKSDYKIPTTSFKSLKDKCLVKLDEDRRIVMHDLLRDMGRQVVMNQSHHMEKGTPSHLWNPKIAEQVLQNKEGTNKIQGLSTFGVGRGGIGATNVAENYIGMNRLHFLLLDGDDVKGDFSTWSRELRWLQWTNSDISALPLELDLRKLVVLDLTSNKELTQIWPNDLEITYKDLRTLILSNCKALKELPKDIGKLLKLNELNLFHCSELGCLPDSIVDLSQLKTFNLRGCSKLENLPMEFEKLQSLVELDLSSCSKLVFLPYSIVDLSQLKTFNLRGCSKLENLPMEFGKLQSLVELDLSSCLKLVCLPNSIVDLSQLKTLNLRGCSKLKNVPLEFGKLQSLVELDLSFCSKLVSLPKSIVDLSQLKTFNLRGCSKLENLPMEFEKLKTQLKTFQSSHLVKDPLKSVGVGDDLFTSPSSPYENKFVNKGCAHNLESEIKGDQELQSLFKNPKVSPMMKQPSTKFKQEMVDIVNAYGLAPISPNVRCAIGKAMQAIGNQTISPSIHGIKPGEIVIAGRFITHSGHLQLLFLDPRSASRVVGVGLDYCSVLLDDSSKILVVGCNKVEWRDWWIDATNKKSFEIVSVHTCLNFDHDENGVNHEEILSDQDMVHRFGVAFSGTHGIVQASHKGSMVLKDTIRPIFWGLRRFFCMLEKGQLTHIDLVGEGNGDHIAQEDTMDEPRFNFASRDDVVDGAHDLRQTDSGIRGNIGGCESGEGNLVNPKDTGNVEHNKHVLNTSDGAIGVGNGGGPDEPNEGDRDEHPDTITTDLAGVIVFNNYNDENDASSDLCC